MEQRESQYRRRDPSFLRVVFGSTFWTSFILLMLFSGALSAQTPAWYLQLIELRPLESTRNQVENVFGSATTLSDGFVQDGIETVFYSDSAGRFTAEYGSGAKVLVNAKNIDVGKNILIRIIYFPNDKIRYNALKIDHKKFYKFWDGHDPAVHFINESLGMDHAVMKNRLIHVELRPRD